MHIKMRVMALVCGLGVGAARSAAAQTSAEHDMFVTVNVGEQPAARTFEVTARPEIYGEIAPINSLAGVDGSTMLDLQGGYCLGDHLWVAVSVTTTLNANSEGPMREARRALLHRQAHRRARTTPCHRLDVG